MKPFLHALRLIGSGDKEVYFIAFTSLRFALSSVVVSTVLSLPLGFVIGYTNFRGKKGVVVALNSLMAVPTVVVGLFVYSFLTRSGPFGSMRLLFTPAAIIVGQAVLCFPVMTSLVYGALSKLDPRLSETLVTLGAGPGRTLWMTIREARVAVLSAVLAGFGRVVGEVGVSMMLGGNIRWYTRTMTTAIALETSKGEFERGIALGIILLAIAFVVNAGLHGAVRHER